ncbi:thiol reductant ABC exporter subunit CydC [Frondihabitans sp. VKM Ac-2883]|uniref:thiol reductant ABC exporter subunit CydC n=1 Tax=Frondihabitans sp. VKM Ac-2883 TaxID=2783823 RepID=UPI00188D49C2|nr:thiol reductant ABC exporter subunit CydC [Frondihabitans sp. VKM Ac-2883]MBF4576353.1 thiol reductant ABC exporter subunit CydC [Frondihabitans sp. VKM Ac-2883]
MTNSILRTAQPSLRRSWPGLAAGVLSALSGVALLAMSAYLITRAAEQPPILYLSIAIVSVRLFALTRAVFRYLERVASHDAAFRQLAVVRTGLYRRLVRIAPAGLGRTDRGDLLSRVVSDVDALQDLPLRVVQPLVISGVSALAAVVAVFIVAPRAGLVLLVGLLVAFVVGCLLASWLARTSEVDLAERRGALSAAVLDTVQNLDVLIAFGAIDGQLDRVDALDADLRSASLRRASSAGIVAGLIALVSGAAVLFSILAAAPSLGHGLTGPEFALVALVPLAVFEVIGAVPVAVLAWRKVAASSRRVDEAAPSSSPVGVVIDDEPDDAPAGLAVELGPVGSPALTLAGVVASWPEPDPGASSSPALSDVTLEVAVGDRVLIEGPSGAGKTTLAQVLVRFLDHSGSYRVGGVADAELRAADVRATVGLIEQTPYLFDENVRQNLLFARDTATDDELTAVLERVGLGEWLRERGGLTARLGERGELVSGGQAQRISLARALLRGFPILVLDEPAAGVDPAVADELLRDLLTAAAADGTTVILISHVPVAASLVTRRVRLAGGHLA